MTNIVPLIRATYREELDKFRQYFFHEHFPDKVHPKYPAPSRPEMISILECVEKPCNPSYMGTFATDCHFITADWNFHRDL